MQIVNKGITMKNSKSLAKFNYQWGHNEPFISASIRGRLLFKAGFYLNKYGMYLLKTCGQEKVTYLITTQNFFLLVPGQDMYKDSGNAKILDFFGLVPKL